MSWHCTDWTDRLTGNYPDSTFDDGDDCDEIYSEARCSSFDARGTFSVDEQNEIYNSEMDQYDSPTCNEHDRSAEWDAAFSAASDLRGVGFFVCEDCDLTYHTEEAHDDHYSEEHDPDSEAPSTYMRTAPSGFGRTGTVSTHSTWASAAPG